MISCCRDTSIEEVHPVGVNVAQQEAEPSTVIAGTQGARVRQLEETREAPKDPTNPQGEVPEHLEPVNEDIPIEPTSRPEPRASPWAQMLVMDLGPSVQPQASRAPKQARESPEVIEEIECEVPETQDPLP